MQALRRIFAVFVLLLVVAVTNNTASAEIKSFTAEGYGYLSEDVTISKAKQDAVKDALRNISEEAGVFIRSYTKAQGGMLTHDEVEAFSASLLKVKSKSFRDIGLASPEMGDGVRIIVAEVTAEVDTDDIDKILAKHRTDRKSASGQGEK